MKPEPLKNKTKCIHGANIEFAFVKDDVLSAIQWLKEKLESEQLIRKSHKLWMQCGCIECIKCRLTFDCIDMAFEDVDARIEAKEQGEEVKT